MEWLLLCLWLAGSLAVGFPMAQLALGKERRLAVLISFGVLGGHSLQMIALIVLWGVMPLETAFYVALVVSVVSGTLLAARSWRLWSKAGLSFGTSRLDAAVIAGLTGSFAFLGHRLFTVAYTTWDVEALYWHSALVGWMGRSTYPPSSPIEPNDVLRYRFGLHALAAAISSDSITLPPEALAATVAVLLPLSVLAFVGVSIRLFGSPRSGIMASLLGLFGGSLMPWYRLAQAVSTSDPSTRSASIVDALGNNWRQGFLWDGNTLDMLVLNVSIAIGFVAAASALWLCWEAIAHSTNRWMASILATASLACLAFTNEVYFAAVSAGVIATGALSSFRARSHHRSGWGRATLSAVGLVFIAYAIVALRGGLLGNLSLTGSGADSLHLVVDPARFGWVIAAPRAGPNHWVPLFSNDVMVDSDFIILAWPILFVIAWRTSNAYAAFGLIASASVFGAWLLVYPGAWPPDAYRFGQAAFVLYLSMIPITLAPIWRNCSPAWSRARFWTGAAVFIALTLPHITAAAGITAEPPKPTQVERASADFAASQYLAVSTETSRILVPLPCPNGGWATLYEDDAPALAMRVMLGLSKHAIPLGHQQAYFDPSAYLPLYRKASAMFDAESLRALKIDWVYVLPAYLTQDQRSNLGMAVQRKELLLTKTFGPPGTAAERWLYRVTPAAE